jgi:hypothetical protein
VLNRRHTPWLARWRKPLGAPVSSLVFLFEAFRPAPLIRCRPHALPAFRTYRGPAPAAKYIDIDAFNGKNVTRQTLSRYTFKSLAVNVLIGGNVWKNKMRPTKLSSRNRTGAGFGFRRRCWHFRSGLCASELRLPRSAGVSPLFRGAEARNLSPRSYFYLDFCYDERI